MEAGIVSLGKESKKKDIWQNFVNGTKILDEIINNERPFYDKSNLRYKQYDEGSSSIMTKGKKIQISYVDVVQGSEPWKEVTNKSLE